MNTKRQQISVLFMIMSTLFCVCLITANVLETKQIQIGCINITGGLLVFPISYIINDCVSEVWGYRRAALVIWLGFAMNLFFVLFGALADAIPGAPYWHNDAGFHAVFGLAPRIAIASFAAFIVGSLINAYVMVRMKQRSGNKHFSLRAIVSTLFGEGADSLIFFPLALYGIVPNTELLYLIVSQIIFKTLYEIIVLPLTIRVVKIVKEKEA
ncbi:MAG: queuosine precursor transporter [Prevotella sp.]|nr:queuosine precursor transporter [Paraprevotella sp.]MCI6201839.1 queuosine precursor transporter [Paraprevotella sp.]MDD5855406.1 queuosine precursor transporter [Prevotella sp.]MDD7692438.1 queuosine precursor transporter [Prevotella sp.]MDY4408433.1 queuosine precursor transporter [Prevotella sp.]